LTTESTGSAAARPECVWTGVQRIVAIGDLHGDFDHFVRLLRWSYLVDGDLHWTGGKSHLVQMGDVMDRGDEAREIFDLIKRLEKEAEDAGGRVHMILGNHEEMNLMNRSTQYPGYVTPAQFKSFLSKEVIAAEEKRAGGRVRDSRWEELIADPETDAAKDYYRNFVELYGHWLAEHNVVIKINDTVFVHGGLTESFAARGLEAINNLYRSELQRLFRGEEFRPRILFVAAGPLWNRDLASTDENQEYKARVDQILKLVGAQRVVVAHTPTAFRGREKDMKRYDGKVWVIDTGISSNTGRVWALLIENGEVSVIRRD
jgi:calcineurin-like phosphoesterase family protein